MDRISTTLLSVLITVLATALGLGVPFWLRRRALENLQQLANELGCEVKPQPAHWGIIPKPPQVEGEHQRRPVRFYCYGETYGEHHQTFSVVAARYRGKEDFVMLVDARPSLRRLFRGPRLERVLTEEMDFDQSFPTKSNDPATAKRLLTPEIREQITAARRQKFGLSGRLIVEKGEARYTVCGSFFSRGRIDYLVQRLELVCGLAKSIETAK